jgi:hypothetical protein
MRNSIHLGRKEELGPIMKSTPKKITFFATTHRTTYVGNTKIQNLTTVAFDVSLSLFLVLVSLSLSGNNERTRKQICGASLPLFNPLLFVPLFVGWFVCLLIRSGERKRRSPFAFLFRNKT